MKKYIYLILLLILPNLSFSQVDYTAFAPEGAAWWHGNMTLSSTDLFPYGISSKVIGDTLIQGRTAAIVEMTNYHKWNAYPNLDSVTYDPYYIASSEDTVFVYNTYFDKFTPLYVFNVVEGDTLCLPVIPHPFKDPDNFESWYNPIAEADSMFCIIVDSVKMVLYDTTYLETVFTTEIAEYAPGDNLTLVYPAYNYASGIVFEGFIYPTMKLGYARKIGSLSSTLLPMPSYYAMSVSGSLDTININFDGPFQGANLTGFRCYSDQDLGIDIYPDRGCDYIRTVSINEQYNSYLDFAIYPNPAREQVHLSFKEPFKEGFVELYDFTGRMLKRAVLSQQEISIDVADIPRGLYLLTIDIDGKKYVEKLSIGN